MTDKIEVPLSQNKMLLAIGGSVLFVLLGVWLFTIADSFEGDSVRLLRNPLVVKGAGILAILFFGAMAVIGITKLFDKKVGLTIDAHGITDNSNASITDNSNASSVGFIAWDDIVRIEKQQMMSTKFLLVHVRNPEEYIARARNGVKAKLMRSNMQMYGTPLSITSNTLKCGFDELERLIGVGFEQSRTLG